MRPVPTLIQDRRETGDDWRWFAALMCMCLFIPEFVKTGTYIWEIGAGDGYPRSVESVSIVTWLWLVRAICFAGISLALVHKSRTILIWILVLLVLTGIGMSAGLWKEFHEYDPSLPFPRGTDPSSPLAILNTIYGWSGQRLPWIAMFVAGVWCRRAARRGVVYRTRTWAIMAAAWCLGDCAVLWSWSHGLNQLIYATAPQPMHLELSIYLPVAMVSTGMLLLWRSTFARATALILVAAGVALHIREVYLWSLLHGAYFGWFPDGPYYGKAPWTRFVFAAHFVEPFINVGPWLIIACFARWAPMANPPEDASPFPRRYCGRCGYNLHGLTTTRCPECGEAFEPVSEVNDGEPV